VTPHHRGPAAGQHSGDVDGGSAGGGAGAVGSFDTPASGSSVAGSIAVTGWALDDIGVDRVEIWRDLVPGETDARPIRGRAPATARSSSPMRSS